LVGGFDDDDDDDEQAVRKNLGLNQITSCFLNVSGGSGKNKIKSPTGRARKEQLLFGRPSWLSFVLITRLTFFSISTSCIFRFNFLVSCFNLIILYEHRGRVAMVSSVMYMCVCSERSVARAWKARRLMEWEWKKKRQKRKEKEIITTAQRY
jgi:hypothetical protein